VVVVVKVNGIERDATLHAWFALLAGSRGKMRVRWSNGMEPTAAATKEGRFSVTVCMVPHVRGDASSSWPSDRHLHHDGIILEHDLRPNLAQRDDIRSTPSIP